MSDFKIAMRMLRSLKKPLFQKMRAERRAYPVEIGIYEKLVAEFPEKQWLIKPGLVCLTRGRRYQIAMLEDGAVRYDADGNPGDAVTDGAREQARNRLRNIEKKVARLWPKPEHSSDMGTSP